MRYDLMEQCLMRHDKEVFIPKDKVIDMYKKLKKDKIISGFIFGIEKRKVV